MFLSIEFIPVPIFIILEVIAWSVQCLLSIHRFKPVELQELVLDIRLQLLFRKYALLHIMSRELFWNYVGILLHYLLIMIEIIAKNLLILNLWSCIFNN